MVSRAAICSQMQVQHLLIRFAYIHTASTHIQYVIPLLGMLLGNCTSSISLGLGTVLEELTSRECPLFPFQLSAYVPDLILVRFSLFWFDSCAA